MFGKNEVRSAEHDASGDSLRVHSVFKTIQGEGPLAGRRCIFIRLAGCNLRCHFCDTEFDKGWDAPQRIESILEAVKTAAGPEDNGHELIVITGGEPLLQNIAPLCDTLFAFGTDTIQIETAGTVWPGAEFEEVLLNSDIRLVCSPKTPKIHPKIEEHCYDYKYILADGEVSARDGLPTFSTQAQNMVAKIFRPTPTQANTIWIQPRDDHDYEKNKANLNITAWSCLTFGHRISIQGHKILGVE